MTNKTWQNLLLRLQSCAYRECRGYGLAVVTVRLILRNGELTGWTKPVPTYLEPGRSRTVDVENDALTDEMINALAAP